MARKRKRRKKNPVDEVLDTIAMLLRPEIVGLTLVVISIFTLLSLFSTSRGSLTGYWINLLESLTGEGVWGVPLLTGILGLWIVIRAIEKMPDLPWQKPVGLLMMFLAYITGMTLWVPTAARSIAANRGELGGWIGLFFADVLEAAISPWGAWAAITVAAIIGLVLVSGQIFIDIALDSRDAILEIWSQRGSSEPQPRQASLFDGVGSGWKSLLGRFRRRGPDEPIINGPILNPTPRSAPTRPEPSGNFETPTPAGPRQSATTPNDEAALTPRIVGGVQRYQVPRLDDMLDSWDRFVDSYDEIRQRGRLIEETLELFGVPARFKEVNIGPSVTQFLIEPGYIERTLRGEVKRTKVKVSKIAALSNDLALALAAPNVRIEAPVPGTSYVGIEVPNRDSNTVGLKELMESDIFQAVKQKGRLVISLGEDVKGKPVVTDLSRMPHLLIAGATGAGKSVCINSIIVSILLTHTPETVRLLMIDPKMVELTVYNDVPHLLSPVVTDVDRASGILFWAVKEMERRYQLFSKANTRDIDRYNTEQRNKGEEVLPYIVVIVDEMADLMMSSPEEVEKHIIRLAQMARAVGIHLIIATQRPSVDVITGLIKANFPARIAFAVTSQTDSRVILDVPGAERLLGKGDMLFMAPDASKLERLQGTFLSDDEINRVARYWKGIASTETYVDPPVPDLAQEMDTLTPSAPASEPSPAEMWSIEEPAAESGEMVQPIFDQIEKMKEVDARDALFDDAVRVVHEAGRGSITLLQRKLRVGYSRASRLVEQLEEAGILGPDQGGNLGREVLDHTPVQDESLQPRIIGGDDDETPRIWM